MKKSVGKEIVFDGSYPITLRFSWDQYKKQHSLGMISGLIDKPDTSVDCDASAFLVEERDGKSAVNCCISYEQLSSEDGGVLHGGDNKDSVTPNNDESIKVDFGKLSPGIKMIVFTLDMLKEEKKHLMLGKLERTKVCISNADTGDVLGDFSIIGMGDKAIQVGTLVRTDAGWTFIPEVVELKNVTDRKELVNNINL